MRFCIRLNTNSKPWVWPSDPISHISPFANDNELLRTTDIDVNRAKRLSIIASQEQGVDRIGNIFTNVFSEFILVFRLLERLIRGKLGDMTIGPGTAERIENAKRNRSGFRHCMVRGSEAIQSHKSESLQQNKQILHGNSYLALLLRGRIAARREHGSQTRQVVILTEAQPTF